MFVYWRVAGRHGTPFADTKTTSTYLNPFSIHIIIHVYPRRGGAALVSVTIRLRIPTSDSGVPFCTKILYAYGFPDPLNPGISSAVDKASDDIYKRVALSWRSRYRMDCDRSSVSDGKCGLRRSRQRSHGFSCGALKNQLFLSFLSKKINSTV